MIDVIILTKLVEDKFFGLLASLKKYTDMSRFNFLVYYTGNSDDEELNYDVSRIFNYNGIKFTQKMI